MQRRLQKGILAFRADRPVTRVLEASKHIIFTFYPPISLYCSFSEGLNAEYVKGENMEAVVSEEPQGESPACPTLSASGHKSSFTEGLSQDPSCCTELLCLFDEDTT